MGFEIVLKVDELLKKYHMSQLKLSKACNIRPATVSNYVNNTAKRLNVRDIEAIYSFFHSLDDRITINDIMETTVDCT